MQPTHGNADVCDCKLSRWLGGGQCHSSGIHRASERSCVPLSYQLRHFLLTVIQSSALRHSPGAISGRRSDAGRQRKGGSDATTFRLFHAVTSSSSLFFSPFLSSSFAPFIIFCFSSFSFHTFFYV